ncbi:MAG: iron-containing alcohol dehydrogenase [Chloroflexota bacterium]|nr:iron-containing alcohol dehydrogenase [Chloroflexota bacterium]MDE2685586.1 iron-containing alcohol dehydrogenase [Chloroflexota bacterium]
MSEITVNPFRHVAYPVRVHAGDNSISNLRREVDRLGAHRPFVVCGQSVARRTNLLQRLAEALGEEPAGVFDGVQTGSPEPAVLEGTRLAREAGADLIVAVGGGSAVVTARAIIIMLAEGGSPQDHATKYPPGQPPISPRLVQPKIPNILALTTPTTAATRAGTAIIDGETGHRLEMFDPKTRPAAIIWDTEALLTAPPELCISASGSLFSGVISALQAPVLNAMATADLLAALGLLVENMPAVRKNPADGDARVNLCAASFMYNRAWDTGASGSALGVVSALAHSLDTRYPECSHGAAYSILTAPGMRFNRSHNVAGQARIADALGVRGHGAGDSEAAEAAADAVSGFFEAVGLPGALREVGVAEDGVVAIAEEAITDFGLHRNVRPVAGAEELEMVLRAAW